MRSAFCTYCHRPVQVLESDWGKQVRCDKVRCLRLFLAIRPAEGTEPSPSPSPPPPPRRVDRLLTIMQRRTTRLTGPHRCQECDGEVHQPIGLRRATIVHRRPGTDENCRLSVYAAIYYCPRPGCGVLLETPHEQWEQPVGCPACSHEFIAPRDDILHEQAGDHREGALFHFRCPSCQGKLRSDSTWYGQPTRGQRVVCLHCDQLIEIPAGAVSPDTAVIE